MAESNQVINPLVVPADQIDKNTSDGGGTGKGLSSGGGSAQG